MYYWCTCTCTTYVYYSSLFPTLNNEPNYIVPIHYWYVQVASAIDPHVGVGLFDWQTLCRIDVSVYVVLHWHSCSLGARVCVTEGRLERARVQWRRQVLVRTAHRQRQPARGRRHAAQRGTYKYEHEYVISSRTSVRYSFASFFVVVDRRNDKSHWILTHTIRGAGVWTRSRCSTNNFDFCQLS